jgi:hypothetical protein
MREIMRYIFVLLVSALPFVATADQDSSDGLALRKSYPIQLYMGACVVARAQPSNVEEQAVYMGFKEAIPDVAENYLQGHKGKAWVTSNEHGNFAITSQERGLCSVFIHQGDPDKLIASMEAWLPPENSGFNYKSELVSESEQLKTTAYKIYRSSTLAEQWVITTAKQPGGQLAAIMSYNAP